MNPSLISLAKSTILSGILFAQLNGFVNDNVKIEVNKCNDSGDEKLYITSYYKFYKNGIKFIDSNGNVKFIDMTNGVDVMITPNK